MVKITISGELSITDKRADEIMEICHVELREKDTIHEILQGFICSEFDTKELVFASYCLGSIRGMMKVEQELNEMQQIVELIKRITKD